MSVERRRRFKKRAKNVKAKQGKKPKRTRDLNPKKELSKEEIEARKKAQRLGMFDKKKKKYKRI